MFQLTDPQRMIMETIRAYTEKEIRPRVPALEAGEISPFALSRKMMDFFGGGGLLAKPLEKLAQMREKGEQTGSGLTQLMSAGGEGGGTPDDPMLMNIFVKELARVSPGLAMSFGASLGLAGGAIMARGTARQIREYAVPLMYQKTVGAWALTEPAAGSDALGGMKTTAVPTEDGHYLLNGSKTFITNAPIADTFVLYAKIDRGQPWREQPVHTFILERGMEGLTTGDPFAKLGMKDSPTGEVFLDNVPAEKARLLGEVESGGGRQDTKDSLGNERSAMPAFAWGMVELCYDTCLAHINAQRQQGLRLSEEQGLLTNLYRIYMHFRNIENIVFQSAWLQKNRVRDPAFINATKAFCSQACVEAVNDAMEILGDKEGQIDGTLGKLFRDAKLLEIGAGTTAINIFSAMRLEIEQAAA